MAATSPVPTTAPCWRGRHPAGWGVGDASVLRRQRTFEDPDARGLVAGLTLDHGRGHVYRPRSKPPRWAYATTSTPLRPRGQVDRVVAVGAGSPGRCGHRSCGRCGRSQRRRASVRLGSAYLAAANVADVTIDDGTAGDHGGAARPPRRSTTNCSPFCALYATAAVTSSCRRQRRRRHRVTDQTVADDASAVRLPAARQPSYAQWSCRSRTLWTASGVAGRIARALRHRRIGRRHRRRGTVDRRRVLRCLEGALRSGAVRQRALHS